MSEAYLGEIRLVSWNFPPKGWAFCNGQLLPINQYQALFALLGTTYGGDGRVTFALPDLRGRAPVHVGDEVALGQRGGASTHTLALNEVPSHTHDAYGSPALGNSGDPRGRMYGRKGRFGRDLYASDTPTVQMEASSVGSTGGSQPHQNMQPYLVMNFAICMSGIFPSAN